MELTKRERRLLNKRGNALLLWLGVLWVAMSIALPIYLAQKWKKTDVIYQTIVERAEGARADGTPAEARLKESLVHHARQLRESPWAPSNRRNRVRIPDIAAHADLPSVGGRANC